MTASANELCGLISRIYVRRCKSFEMLPNAPLEDIDGSATRYGFFTSPPNSRQSQSDAIETFWEFRFFFNGLSHLLRNHRPIRKRCLELRDKVLHSIEVDISYLAERGYFLPEKSPNSFNLLVDNIWGLFLNWLRMAQIESPLSPKPEKQAIHDCVTHFWSLVPSNRRQGRPQPGVPDGSSIPRTKLESIFQFHSIRPGFVRRGRMRRAGRLGVEARKPTGRSSGSKRSPRRSGW